MGPKWKLISLLIYGYNFFATDNNFSAQCRSLLRILSRFARIFYSKIMLEHTHRKCFYSVSGNQHPSSCMDCIRHGICQPLSTCRIASVNTTADRHICGILTTLQQEWNAVPLYIIQRHPFNEETLYSLHCCQ